MFLAPISQQMMPRYVLIFGCEHSSRAEDLEMLGVAVNTGTLAVRSTNNSSSYCRLSCFFRFLQFLEGKITKYQNIFGNYTVSSQCNLLVLAQFENRNSVYVVWVPLSSDATNIWSTHSCSRQGGKFPLKSYRRHIHVICMLSIVL